MAIVKKSVSKKSTPKVKKTAKAVSQTKSPVKVTSAPKKLAPKPVKIVKQAEPVKTLSKSGKKPLTMEELLAHSSYTLVVPQKGEVLKGRITAKNKKVLLVDLGAKTEGVVSDKEYDFASEFIKELKVGDEII